MGVQDQHPQGTGETRAKDRKRFEVPHSFVIIFGILVLATVMTWLVPAGAFDREQNAEGREVVVPGSFHQVEANPVDPFGMMQAIPAGMVDIGWLIFLVFIIGGAFGIINATGAVESGIGAIIRRFAGKEALLIPVIMTVFSIGGGLIGMAESSLLFIPMMVVLARRMGYDGITGFAIVNVGAVVGFTAGAMNVFTTGVAQGIAELPLFSGLWYRLICHAVFLTAGILFVMRYARKVKKNPRAGLMYDTERRLAQELEENPVGDFSGRHKLVLLVMLAGFGVVVYGIINGWSTATDLAAIFLTMGIVAGLAGGLGPSRIAETFVEGAAAIALGALIIGLSRAIVVVLTEGNILDSLVMYLATPLEAFPPAISAGLMLVFQVIVSFFIASGSGMAAVTMPIMTPLADLIGISRQAAVLAYQFGDGFTNSYFPTSGILMAGLALARIPYDKWVRYFTGLILILYLLGLILVVVAALIGL